MRDGPTSLYRAFDIDDRLLYIGIAIDWGHRWSHHRNRTPWYDQVARLQIEWHPTRAAARQAEKLAIGAEQPMHNIEHTARDTRPARHRSNSARTSLYARSFDHSEQASAEQYRRAYEAIDQLASARLGLGNQEALVQLVSDMARSVPYGDCCGSCDAICYPIAVDVEGEWLTAGYRHCGATWTCGWAVDAPLMFP